MERRAQGLVIYNVAGTCLHLAVRRKNGVINKRCKQATSMGIAQNTQGNIYILTSLARKQYAMAFVATDIPSHSFNARDRAHPQVRSGRLALDIVHARRS